MALGWIARALKGVENLVGIQVLNEVSLGAECLWEWYENVVKEIGAVDQEIPVHVSGGWDLGKAFTNQSSPTSSTQTLRV